MSLNAIKDFGNFALNDYSKVINKSVNNLTNKNIVAKAAVAFAALAALYLFPITTLTFAAVHLVYSYLKSDRSIPQTFRTEVLNEPTGVEKAAAKVTSGTKKAASWFQREITGAYRVIDRGLTTISNQWDGKE